VRERARGGARSLHKAGFVLLVTLLIVLLAYVAYGEVAVPSELNQVTVSRRGDTTVAAVPAYAGNVTELNIDTSTVTQGWQGYYGSVTGAIVLDDAQNQSIYAWEYTNPQGEIYATRNATVINWTATNIICANITHIETEESELNFNLEGSQDLDGINETFTYITHPGFNVSNEGFESDECNFTVSTYVNDTAPGGDTPRAFNETLLYSSSDAGLIYMAYLNDDAYGFNATPYDFQMLVAEDGHSGDTATTMYYFYVEIE